MKSMSNIHQQTLNILVRMSSRRHSSPEAMDAVVEIHNRYLANICRHFGVPDVSRLSLAQANTMLPCRVYAANVNPC